MTEASPADTEAARKLLEPYWSEWAKSRGGEAVAALEKVRASLGR